MKAITNFLLAGAGFALGAKAGLRVGHLLRPRPMPRQFAWTLDHPLRMKYRNPGEVLGLFGFVAGMSTLDLGCGVGTFTEEMARMVGAEGTIHAVDLQRTLLERARRRLIEAGLAERVRFHHCGAYHLPLQDDSVDLAVLISVLSEIPDKLRALAELQRVLKPGGRLAVSEEMPDPAYVPAFAVRKWLTDAGFRYGGISRSFLCYSMVYFNDK